MKKVIIIIVSVIALIIILGISLGISSIFFLHSAFETIFPNSVVHVGTSGEYAEKTEKLLEKKYGEKFKVIRYGNNRATVYPEANPDLLFTARRYAVSDVVDDDYIQEIVGLQYKKLAEDVLKDFKYDYYLDVDLEFTYEPIDAKQDVTIEEFKKVFPEELEPTYNLYVIDQAHELSNEELYELVNNIATIPEQENSVVNMFFVNEIEMDRVIEFYKSYSYRTGDFQTFIMEMEIQYAQQQVDNNELLIDFERFTQIMNGEYVKK